MSEDAQVELETLLAKQAVRDALSRYCRGLDRMDKAMAYAVWHPDGTADYEGIFEGTGHGFVDWVWEVRETALSTLRHDFFGDCPSN